MYIYGIKMSSIINNAINVYFPGILILLDCPPYLLIFGFMYFKNKKY